MRKAVPILIVASTVVIALVIVACFAIYRAKNSEPEFYRTALSVDPASQRQASDEFVIKALALASDVQTKGKWRISFTSDEINGWLAVDVPTNLPDAIPPEVADPRVEIQPGEATIACHLKTDELDAVVSLTLDVFVSAPTRSRFGFVVPRLVRCQYRSARCCNRSAKRPLSLTCRLFGDSKTAIPSR